MNNDVSTSQNSTTAVIEVPDSEPQSLDDDVEIINSQDKCVTLDDDSDVVIQENPVVIDIDSDDLEIIERTNTPILIEDEDRNCVINPLNVIRKKQDQLFDIVCLENSILAQVIEDAINLDDSGYMKRIIHRTLIPLYLNCDASYKKSDIFRNALRRTSILLETTPHLKYSHIKNLCESLKHRIKIQRNARLVKKQTQVQTNKSPPKKRKCKYPLLKRRKKRKKNITNVDHTKPKNTKTGTETTISTGNNTDSSTMIEIEIPSITSVSFSSNKENNVTDTIQTTNERLNSNANNIAPVDTTNNIDIEDNLLRAHYIVDTKITSPNRNMGQTIESLEKQIAVLKMNLEKIEEQEVTDDNLTSPYLIAETLKLKIVKLYKQLCDLTGSEPTKRHKVKLQVINGHPPGPARCLEEYINDNIDEYGNLPFPDIFEVVRCVEKAVEQDRLYWNKNKIVAEAQVLLKHCGHALQKRRKKREWRDMVSRCKEELVDPADLDPALEAKLLENSRIAKRKEDEILDRYVRLEKENSSNPAFRLSLETAGGETGESDTDEDTHRPSHNNKTVENDKQEAPCLTMADSTTNLENLQGCHVIDSNNVQGNTGIINSTTNIVESIQSASNAINPRNVLEINPLGCSGLVDSINVVNSNLQSHSNAINADNIVESSQNVSSFINTTTNLPSNLQNCPILIVNSDNLLPNLHGSICFINSKPVLATRIQGCPGLMNTINNLDGNLHIAPNNVTENLQNGPNNVASNLQNGHSFVNNNLTSNLQSGSNFINASNNLAGSFQNELNFINSFNNLDNNQQICPSIINTSKSIADNLQSGLNFINSSHNLKGNLQSGPNNKEGNLHSCAIDSTTDKEIQTAATNIGNVEYSRTIMMDSAESDQDNERQGHTDMVTCTENGKERDKSETDEIESKIKIKQEQDDVIKLLSELGSDCVATVFDIEDPFLVIEISDSSEEE